MASVSKSVIPSKSSFPAEFKSSVNGVGFTLRAEALSFFEMGFLCGVLTGVTSASVVWPAVLSKKLSISLSGIELCRVRRGFSDSTFVISSQKSATDSWKKIDVTFYLRQANVRTRRLVLQLLVIRKETNGEWSACIHHKSPEANSCFTDKAKALILRI